MQNIILTGVDGSETATKAAEVAASLATDLKCDLYVISAADPNQVELPRLGRLTSESEGRNEMAARQNSLDALSRAATANGRGSCRAVAGEISKPEHHGKGHRQVSC